MTDVINRQKELTKILSEASRAYYAEDREIMSNFEYDKLYDELLALEEKSGTVMAGSPTVTVGYEPVTALPKETHPSPMLSLNKTKSREELREWLGDKEGLLSWKEDGLTVVLTYVKGSLEKAVTRGNGEVGEVITPNAMTFKELPLRIPYKGRLVIRGEAVITYSDFERINESNPDTDALYKNPRNLCSGSVRALDPKVTAARNVRVIIFSLVEASDAETGEAHDFSHSFENEFRFLREQGFTTVEYKRVTADTVVDAIGEFENKIKDNDIPSDGLVLSYDDLAYAASLGRTAKFPRGAIAFKWADENAETTLRSVEWQTSRTGLINPVAVFDPVELEGTEVRRASVHNVSMIKQLKLGIGDRIRVFKANMIIPQISENLTCSDSLEIPDVCPVCGGRTEIKKQVDSEVLMCTAPDCPAKALKAFVHFTERDAMNIEGLSEATLEKLIAAGLIKDFHDIYHLGEHREEILEMEGFKEKSCENLLSSIEKSRQVAVHRMLYALGIPGIGLAGARLIAAHFSYDMDAVRSAKTDELSEIEGIGAVLAGAFHEYMSDAGNAQALDLFLKELQLDIPAKHEGGSDLSGKSFVITGSLTHFANRSDLKELIESYGGKVTGSVTSKTECLINNDPGSTSSKNQTAKKNGISILTEDEFLNRYMPGHTI